MASPNGSHTTALLLLGLLTLAIGLHVYAVRVKAVRPSRRLPVTSLSHDGRTAIPASQSRRIQQVIRN